MIEPTSAAEFAASTDGGVPPLGRVTDDTWVVAMPLPEITGATVPYTLTYLLLDAEGAVHIIDAGVDTPRNEDILASTLAELGDPRVASVTATHMHPDHLGLAARLRSERGTKIVLHEREQRALDGMMNGEDEIAVLTARWGVPDGGLGDLPTRLGRGFDRLSPPADVLVIDGDVLDIPGRDIRVVFTPGHTPGHICLRDYAQGLVFTGDHVLPTVYPGLGLGGPSERSPIADYLDSLDRIRVFDGDEVLPGHGYRFRGLEERVATIEAHHRKRTAEVAAASEAAPGASVWEIASRVGWTAGWENLRGFLRFSALAQTEMHLRYLAGS